MTEKPTNAELLRASQAANRILNILDEKPRLNAGEIGIILGTVLASIKETYKRDHGLHHFSMMRGIFAILEPMVFDNANDNSGAKDAK